MKAAVYKAPGAPLEIEDVPDPTPGPGDLVLEVRACGICGTDLHWSQGTDPAAGWRELLPGAVMGHEFAGEVVAVGRDLEGRWKPGDRVCAQPSIGCGHCPACLAGRSYRCPEVVTRGSAALTGAYAQYTRAGAAETLRLPESVDYVGGALVEPLAVGLNAVNQARLESGDTVLVIGAGPVGLAVALWCRFFGARHVIVSDLVAARAERAAAFGATGAIDASREDVVASAVRIAGTPPNVIFECVGVPGSLQLAIDYAPPHARLVIVGLCMAKDVVMPAVALSKELHVAFAFVYKRRDFEIVIDMLARERIDVGGLVTGRVDMHAFSDTFEGLKTPGDQLKVVLEPN